MGDFNVDLLKSSGNNNTASDLLNNLSSHFFTPFVLQPTRLKSRTLIDNIFVMITSLLTHQNTNRIVEIYFLHNLIILHNL